MSYWNSSITYKYTSTAQASLSHSWKVSSSQWDAQLSGNAYFSTWHGENTQVTTQLRPTIFPLLNWNFKRQVCDTLRIMVAACWIFRVRSCMIQIIKVGFSLWEFLSPCKSILKLVYPCMFMKHIVIPWTWNDAKISRRGTPCLWKGNYTILGPMLFLIFINDLNTGVECTWSLLKRSSGFPRL